MKAGRHPVASARSSNSRCWIRRRFARSLFRLRLLVRLVLGRHLVGLQELLGGQHTFADLGGEVRVLLEEGLRVLATLAKARGLVVVPGATLLNDAARAGEVEQVAL